MKLRGDDTIAAIATAMGEGAISIVRVSGPRSIPIVDSIFRSKNPLTQAKGYTIHLGGLVSPSGSLIDQVLVSVFRSPHSYTGEDAIEISSHGGILVVRSVLAAVLASGARQADPGEFTKRAFLNGKIDLAQAEAVAGLIAAKSEKAAIASLDQLQGKLSREIHSLRSALQDICSLLELQLDFIDEGIEIAPRDVVLEKISRIEKRIENLLASHAKGRIIREGASIAIVGKPNAGKSSVFNALLNADRSIVNHNPGTTRDTIEESVQIGGMLFKLIDTAGIRDSLDPIESEGIRRTRSSVELADATLLILDATDENNHSILDSISKTAKPAIIAINKIDLRIPEFQDQVKPRPVLVSARTGQGIEDLRNSIQFAFESTDPHVDGFQITSIRHAELLSQALESLRSARIAVAQRLTGDIISIDLRASIGYIGEIVGEVTTDDILNSIFESFCIGK